MPFYDPASLISDKQHMVIDLGSRYTKFGLSGESSPRCIIPTQVTSSDSGQTRRIFDYEDEDDLRSLLVDFLHMLFFRWALIHPKEKRIVVVESLLCPTQIREALAHVLYGHFEVASALFLPSHPVALYTLGVDTGLVIDVGQSEAVLIPVYKGIPILRAWQALPLGSKAVENNLLDLLTGKVKQFGGHGNTNILENVSSVLTSSVLEDIKVKGCFVTTLQRAQIIAKGEIPSPQPPGFTYRLGGDKVIEIDAADRELPYEILFEPDEDMRCLPTMVLDSLLACSVDMRKPLAENIVLIGGTVMAKGFKARLQQELLHLIKSPKYSNKLFIKTFKFHSPPAKENYVAWLGGSICGATDAIVQKSVTKDTYVEVNRKLPDWCNLLFNKLSI